VQKITTPYVSSIAFFWMVHILVQRTEKHTSWYAMKLSWVLMGHTQLALTNILGFSKEISNQGNHK